MAGRIGAGLGLLLGLAASGGASELESWVRRFAPVVRQDTAGTQDYITRFDFDGDWNGANNWDNQDRFPNDAAVYWSAIETPTHAYLTYAFFHPRDWAWFNNPLLSHENDLEGVLLVVEKAPAGPRVVAAETVFHLSFKRYTAPGGLEPKGKNDGTLRFEGERAVVQSESHGHGVEAWKGDEFPGGDGVVYRPGTAAEVPAGPDDRDVSYALIPIESTLWARRFEVGEGKAYGKAAEFSAMGSDGATEAGFGYAFLGRKYGDDKANAPWGWSAEGLARGTFFLDPAGMIAAHYRVPAGFSQDYLANPFTSRAAARDLARRHAFDVLHQEAAD